VVRTVTDKRSPPDDRCGARRNEMTHASTGFERRAAWQQSAGLRLRPVWAVRRRYWLLLPWQVRSRIRSDVRRFARGRGNTGEGNR
jgi:hypothetical protein